MGVGGIVDQNSDKKDGWKEPIILNSRSGLWGLWWKKDGCWTNSRTEFW